MAATLQHISQLKNEMTLSIRQGLQEICKVQGLTVLLLFLSAPNLLDLPGMPRYFLLLFCVDLAGGSIQVVLMALLNVFSYQDKRIVMLELCVFFVVLNALLMLLGQSRGRRSSVMVHRVTVLLRVVRPAEASHGAG